MKDLNQIIAVENYNKEHIKLYHSKSSRLLRNINTIRNGSLKDAIRLMRKRIITIIGDIKIKNNILSKEPTQHYYEEGTPIENIKVAVYTCITGGYDNAKPPVYVGKDTDYFVYTDSKMVNSSIWKSRQIDYSDFSQNANRYYKFHPFEYFSDYDYAIYIDGNVQIVTDVTTLCSIAHNCKSGIAMHAHHSRDCAYQEAKACHYYKRGNKENIEAQIARFKKEGFPERFGLYEATIIVYDLTNLLAKKIAIDWWNEYIDSNTKRDQISFPYIIWKNNLSIDDVGCLGNNLWDNPKFVIYGHA